MQLELFDVRMWDFGAELGSETTVQIKAKDEADAELIASLEFDFDNFDASKAGGA